MQWNVIVACKTSGIFFAENEKKNIKPTQQIKSSTRNQDGPPVRPNTRLFNQRINSIKCRSSEKFSTLLASLSLSERTYISKVN